MTFIRLGDTIINMDNIDYIDINPNGTVSFVFYCDSEDPGRSTLTIGAEDSAEFRSQIDGFTFTPSGLAQFETSKYKRIVQ